MKFKPILFNTPMVQAILEGRKTQTRRIVKSNGIVHTANKISLINGNWQGESGRIIKCPYGQPGDVLWVREKWCKNNIPTGWPFHYYANNDTFTNPDYEKWKPGIHMPKSACRMWDKIISVRAERVADISEEDAISEGVEPVIYDIAPSAYNDMYGDWDSGYRDYLTNDYVPNAEYPYVRKAKKSFRSLWQKINGTPKPIQKKANGKLITTAYEVYPFDEEAARPFAGMSQYRGKPLTVIVNPYVWCISFKPIDKPENWPV